MCRGFHGEARTLDLPITGKAFLPLDRQPGKTTNVFLAEDIFLLYGTFSDGMFRDGTFSDGPMGYTVHDGITS